MILDKINKLLTSYLTINIIKTYILKIINTDFY